jgi:mannose-1-phosphate guanylyltransferase
MLIPVVMAGGTGSRLWPVSRESFPKQFVSFQGSEASLFQQTLKRLEGLEGLQAPIVLCNENHRFLVAEQLQELGIEDAEIILEPIVRNTAPAVALAAFSAIEAHPDAVLLVLAADHNIENISNFHQAINLANESAENSHLCTFGILPDKPEAAYGYIKKAEKNGSTYQVESFVEKPDIETAKTYLASGDYLWNSGMFMFKAVSYLDELKTFSPEIFSSCQQAFLSSKKETDFRRIPEELFALSPSDSIDYAVMEHTKKAAVVPLDADWNDLGAWDALWDNADKDKQGNAIIGDVCLQDVKISYIHAGSRLVSVLGLEDAIVIETPDSVLVSNKESSQNVKAIVEKLNNENRSETVEHNVVRRPWGTYESLAKGENYQVKRIIVNSGGSLSLQLHHKRAEHWTVVSGKAKVTNGEDVFFLEADQSTYIPIGQKHRLENPSD